MDDAPPHDPAIAPVAPARAREPAFNAPAVVVASIAAMAAIQFARMAMPVAWDDWIIAEFS
ncbi:MAG: hypothetical protein KGQ28_11055, partial [Hyphomicrobiales bacterium]|nr:hypothetical protein [Hyphomicrobiales bacterium]